MGFAERLRLNVSIALADLGVDSGVLELQIVFKLICAHDANDGDAIFFQDEVLVPQVGALCHLTEVDTGLRYGKVIDHVKA